MGRSRDVQNIQIMKTLTTNARLYTGLIFCCLMLGNLSINGQVIKKTVEEMTQDSKTILYGQCTQIESSWDENQERIYTEISVQTAAYLKGAKGSEITITVPGGRVGNIMYEVSDMPTFTEGEEFVAFLSEHSSGRNLVTGAIQGKLEIFQDANTGVRLIIRPVKEETSAKKAATIYDESTQEKEVIPLDDFIAEINGYLGQ